MWVRPAYSRSEFKISSTSHTKNRSDMISQLEMNYLQ